MPLSAFISKKDITRHQTLCIFSVILFYFFKHSLHQKASDNSQNTGKDWWRELISSCHICCVNKIPVTKLEHTYIIYTYIPHQATLHTGMEFTLSISPTDFHNPETHDFPWLPRLYICFLGGF